MIGEQTTNVRDWKKFYEKERVPLKPSSFAKFCLPFLKEPILDIGCGNFRDTNYFKKHFKKVRGIDKATTGEDVFSVDLSKYKSFYMRFFLHCLSNKEIKKLLKKIKGVVFIECRAKGDKPKIWKNHKRNYIDGNWLLKTMIKKGFEIKYFQKGRGLAKFKNEDPLVIRVIAKK